MHAVNTARVADLQAKFGVYVLQITQPSNNPYYKRNVTFYREPLSGDECHFRRPAVAVQRLVLPYCVVTMNDGTECLCNREYNTLWSRSRGGSPVRVASTLPIGERNTVWLYNDGTLQPDRVVAGRRVCAEWGLSLPENLADLVVPL